MHSLHTVLLSHVIVNYSRYRESILKNVILSFSGNIRFGFADRKKVVLKNFGRENYSINFHRTRNIHINLANVGAREGLYTNF